MSHVESNHRPYQAWPMQNVWEEDENSVNGLPRERWQQVENLEDALTNRVQVKELRLGTAKTDTIYYQAMKERCQTWPGHTLTVGRPLQG